MTRVCWALWGSTEVAAARVLLFRGDGWIPGLLRTSLVAGWLCNGADKPKTKPSIVRSWNRGHQLLMMFPAGYRSVTFPITLRELNLYSGVMNSAGSALMCLHKYGKALRHFQYHCLMLQPLNYGSCEP
ncbi:hypothetical protein OUZ56_021683 [Daphnia magna]|uniref:Secreted protein n=1 Tax=Daphnia magna TaxID=35525 RepID=A0ABR0AUE5_9CRUS|nr:hypothetical protein OUZ56_021683 [Daphnia magna]